jgi:hypothetical protein
LLAPLASIFRLLFQAEARYMTIQSDERALMPVPTSLNDSDKEGDYPQYSLAFPQGMFFELLLDAYFMCCFRR